MTLRFALIVLCCGALLGVAPTNAELQLLPYKAEGLSKEQAAAYLLERFAFGPRPGEVEKVAQMGPEKWLAQQLAGNLPETELDKRLEAFPALKMTQAEMQAIYVQNGRIRRILQREGVIDAAKMDRKEMNKKISAYRKKHGLRAYNALYNQELRGQKVMRAVYSENQLTEVLTGWAAMPYNNARKNLEKQIAKGSNKVIREGEFVFRRDWHDKNAKVVLGEKIPAGGGIEEGERVLDMLSKHSSTAHFISTKLARRFVNDSPPGALIERMANTFRKTDGDIAAVMATLAQSREFWVEAKKRSKMKSPFELVVSSLRALEADVKNPQPMMG